MADKDVTELDEHTTPALDDLLLVIKDPSGTPEEVKAEIQNVLNAGPVRHMFFAYENASQTFSHAVDTVLGLNTTFIDTDSGFSDPTYTIPAGLGGIWYVGGTIKLSAGKHRFTRLTIWGSSTGDNIYATDTKLKNSSMMTLVSASGMAYFAAGAEIELKAYTISGTAATRTAEYTYLAWPVLWGIKVG